ncbi:hypothetical protein [Jeotgalibacillus terrae]|uniref:Uncharacterized protein n=1 Tax=Jeotgalibacillus terrae TaxID=587735 RepID=A0ABW5ZL95_9BACL|nr:hypothetical protein [Jeotgalibacillus terrae]MBM7578704.1 putative membrane protein [Jeotgalibacillus terrae]
MNKVLFGIFLVFFKTNTSFLDIGIVYSLTNLIGYIMIFFGLKELERRYEVITRAQSVVILMILHSVTLFLLNATGNSPLEIPIDSYTAILAAAGLVFVVGGMFMIFVVISQLLRVFEHGAGAQFYVRRLNVICAAMMTVFVLAGLSYFLFQMTPGVAQVWMAVLLLLKVVFIASFYSEMIRHKERLAEQ